MVGQPGNIRVPLGRQRNHLTIARLDFLNIGDDLVVHLILLRQHDHRHVFINQRNRSMLHLGGRVSLGMDVGNLLQLEGAFQRDREIDAASQIEEVVLVADKVRRFS